MSKAEMYVDFLREEGYVPKVDEDGDVVFKCEGRTYIVFGEEKDESYFRLAFPAFWEIESADEEDQAREAINELNAKMKVMKLFIVRDNVWASVEMFLDPIESFKSVFTRSLNLLQQGVNEFRDQMQPQEEDEDDDSDRGLGGLGDLGGV